MPRLSAPSTPRGPRPALASRPPGPLAALLLSAPLLLGLAPVARAAEPLYPSRAELRELQLTSFDCARDNLSGDCDRARQKADQLLDHPSLPGVCKDSLWTILQEAEVAPRNSFERRDRLDQAAEDLMRLCPRNPPASSGGAAPAGPPRPGGGFGGFRVGPGR